MSNTDHSFIQLPCYLPQCPFSAILRLCPLLSYYSDSLRAGRSGDRISVGARFYAPVHTGPAAHPASYTTGTGSSPGIKRPWHGVDHPLPSSAEVKERVQLYIYSHPGLCGMFWVNFVFVFCVGPAVTHRMYCSLPRLIVQPRFSPPSSPEALHIRRHEMPLLARNVRSNLAYNCDFHGNCRVL
jgi:hypothetical protein